MKVLWSAVFLTLVAVFSLADVMAQPDPAPRPASASPSAAAAAPTPVLPRITAQAHLDRWIKRWPNMRMGHPLEIWANDAAATHPIRTRAECSEELEQAGIHAATADPSPLVAAAVTIREPIHGVRFMDGHGASMTYACELVSRLVLFADVLSEQGIHRVTIASGYRDNPRVSFHTLGLAMDVSRYFRDDGSDLRVLRDYERTPDAATCGATLHSEKAQALQRLACALHERRVFSSVLTPNYNIGHHDHMHLDWRPGDERFYIR